MASELAKRVSVAGVGIPLLVGFTYLGGWYLAALVAVVAGIGTMEFCRLARASGSAPFDLAGAAASALLVLGAVGTTPVEAASRTWNTAMLFLLAIVAMAIWRRGPRRAPLTAACVTVAGVLFVGGTLSYVVWLREFPATRSAFVAPELSSGWQGTALVGFPVLITWLNDTFAYFAGRAFGRSKLAPAVSPGKTVEGSVAGLLAGVVVATTYGLIVLNPRLGLAVPAIAWGIGGVIVAVAGQVGDLAESLFKREAGVKDSGALLPGHGGILDRFDALFFAIPVSYWFLRWAGLQ